MKWISSGRGLVVLLAAVAVFTIALGAWQGWLAQAAPSVVYVNDNALPDVEGCNTTTHNTIADGITAADASDTVILCEGTYAGNVTVSKGVTIEGRADANRDEIVIQGSSDGLIIATNDVTISHLKLNGPGAADNGILINAGTDDTTISDVESTGWWDGIHVTDSTDTVIEKSSLHDNSSDGVELVDGERNKVRDNEEIKDNGYGVYVHGEDEALVEGNKLSGNTNNQILVGGKTYVLIYRNEIEAGSDGVVIAGSVPAEAFIQIGGSADKANIFSGTLGAGDYYVELACPSENTVDATYNWWGSAVRAEIATSILNDEDTIADCAAPDNLKGAVVFHPWLEAEPTPTPTATPSPTATATATATPPAGTRDFSLDPAGWHSFVWTGASGTAPADALSCIAGAGNYEVAYFWKGPMVGWKRYVPDRPDLTEVFTVDQYNMAFVLIKADGLTCHNMPVVTP